LSLLFAPPSRGLATCGKTKKKKNNENIDLLDHLVTMLACESHLLCRAVLITIFAEVGAMNQRLDGDTGKNR
jgi:hypothetical protein